MGDGEFKFVGTVGVLATLAVCLVSAAGGCMPNYSSGERAGIVRKVSNKGVMFKSWEAGALLTVPAGESAAMQPEVFAFSVELSAVPKVQAAATSGKRVELVYHQYAIKPLSQDSEYVVTDVKEPQR